MVRRRASPVSDVTSHSPVTDHSSSTSYDAPLRLGSSSIRRRATLFLPLAASDAVKPAGPAFLTTAVSSYAPSTYCDARLLPAAAMRRSAHVVPTRAGVAGRVWKKRSTSARRAA